MEESLGWIRVVWSSKYRSYMPKTARARPEDPKPEARACPKQRSPATGPQQQPQGRILTGRIPVIYRAGCLRTIKVSTRTAFISFNRTRTDKTLFKQPKNLSTSTSIYSIPTSISPLKEPYPYPPLSSPNSRPLI